MTTEMIRSLGFGLSLPFAFYIDLCTGVCVCLWRRGLEGLWVSVLR